MIVVFSVIFHLVAELCATSIAIADAFQHRMLSFSATVAGLSSNAGIALAVLFKESKNKADSMGVAILLVVAGFLAGMLASILVPAL